METATILLDNGDKVNRFVTAMSKYRCPIHLTTKRYKVDAKSLIGIFGFNKTAYCRNWNAQPPSGTGANRCGITRFGRICSIRCIIIGRSIRLLLLFLYLLFQFFA